MSKQPAPPLELGAHSLLTIERHGERLHIVLTGMTNHELRSVMIGLWATLPAADQAEHLQELTHYATERERSFLPGLSQMIATALGHPWTPPAREG